jgi:hypothetical protein
MTSVNTENKTPQAHAPSHPVEEDAGWFGLSNPLSGGCGLWDWIPAMILILFLLTSHSWGNYQTPPSAVLKDLVSSRSKSDETNPDGDTKTLGCSLQGGKMKVDFQMTQGPSGTYERILKKGTQVIAKATASEHPELRLTSDNGWKATKENIDPGFYTLEIACTFENISLEISSARSISCQWS